MKSRFKFCLLLFSFFCRIAVAANYNINGNLTGFQQPVKIYLFDKESENLLDSTTLKKGSFRLTGYLQDGPMYLSIEIHEGDSKYEKLVFVGLGLVSISGDNNDFPDNLIVTGGIEQQKYNDYLNVLKPENIQADAAWLAYTKSTGDEKSKAALEYNEIGNSKRRIEKKWIFSNKDTYFAANQIYNYLPELTIDTVNLFYTGLPDRIKNSLYGKRIYNYLTKGDTLKIKDKYFDFEAFDSFGKKIKLSSLLSKYILLDFSSVACGPCRQSIDELRLLAQKYKDKLNVVTFTLDKRSDWLKEIKDDNVTWISVIDPLGSYSKTRLKYNVQSIPTFYLISTNGIIVNKWVSYEKLISGTGDIEKHLLEIGLAQK